MLTHKDVWDALDRLAEKNRVSVSRMASLAGLNPSLFNKSKRINEDGVEKWPSLKTLVLVLNQTGTSLKDFAELCHTNTHMYISPMPSTHTRALCIESNTIDQIPYQTDDSEIDKNCFILHIDTNRFAPCLDEGDKVIVTPTHNIHKKDTIIIWQDTKLYAGEMIQNTAYGMTLKNGSKVKTITHKNISQILRVLWKAL